MNFVNNGLRILVVDCQVPSLEDKFELVPWDEFQDLKNERDYIHLLKHPTVEELHSEIVQLRPEIVYCFGGISPDRDLLNGQLTPLSFQDASPTSASGEEIQTLVEIFQGLEVPLLYFDAPLSPSEVAEMRKKDCFRELIYWNENYQTSAVVCLQFAHCFFAMLHITSVSFGEAFSIATRSLQLLSENLIREKPGVSIVPSYLSPDEPELPHSNTVPLDPIPNIRFLENESIPDVEGWEEALLLAPKAELRVLICGDSSTINVTRLTALGEALRALLVIEMRTLTVTNITRCERVPSNLSINSGAVRCHIKTASGIESVVVLGGPPSVLTNQHLVQHALRQTLTVDSLCLQFRLPSPSLPATVARSSAFVAGGTPVVDALIHTSVWTVQVLRGLAQSDGYRGLVALGIAGVGGNALVHFRQTDTVRYNTIVTGMQNEALIAPQGDPPSSILDDKMIPEPLSNVKMELGGHGVNEDSDLDLVEELDTDFAFNMETEAELDDVSKTSTDQLFLQMPTLADIDFQSTRPPLNRCTESEFYEDLVAFLQTRRGKVLDKDKFPEAVLNGVQLDLFNLYKEVVSRGGFRVGNGINWKGQVFPKMRNWTANHKMTGVGNALKRHYQGYLSEYEMFHAEDLTGDGCWLCGSSDEVGADWICCDRCERWVHFACDKRPFLGTFKDYATGDGRTHVSNATRHPAHLRKRFIVRTQELWNEIDPVFQGYKYADSEPDSLIKDRTGRTILGSMTLLFQKYHKGVSIKNTNKQRQYFSTDRHYLLTNTIPELSDDELATPSVFSARAKEKKIKEMNSYLKQTLKPIKKELIFLKYRDDEDTVIQLLHLGKRVMYEIENAYEHYVDWLEYPQCCHLLQRIGRVAYNYEDKQWIFDAYTPLIQSLAKRVPPELDLLTPTQLINAFYGLACLGPSVLELKLDDHKRVYLIDELMEDLLVHALSIMDDLNGMDRCLLIEGVVLIGKRLTPDQLEVLLHDAYPLMKVRFGPGVVHSDQLAALLWSMGRHEDCVDHWSITKTFLREMNDEKRFTQLKPVDMSRSIYGLGKLAADVDYTEFMQKVRRYFQFIVDVNQRHLFNHEVVEFAQGLVLLPHRPQGVLDLVEYLLRDISKRQTPLTETQKDIIIKSCLALDYPMDMSRLRGSYSCDMNLNL
eukprot:g2628.t1